MNNELNKKLAEWADIKPYNSDTYSKKELRQWRYDHTPDFTESLGACFKWLVPKVRVKLNKTEHSTRYYSFLLDWIADAESGKDEALTLCLAIEKLIDGAPSA